LTIKAKPKQLKIMKRIKRTFTISLAMLAWMFSLASPQLSCLQATKDEPLPQGQKAVGEKSDSIKKVRTAPLPLSAQGGLILPKIRLSGAKSLSPYAEETDGDFAKKKESLVGLVVYHTGSNGEAGSSLPAGVYVWSGETWLRISRPAEGAEL
jgi:hypothetical protein